MNAFTISILRTHSYSVSHPFIQVIYDTKFIKSFGFKVTSNTIKSFGITKQMSDGNLSIGHLEPTKEPKYEIKRRYVI